MFLGKYVLVFQDHWSWDSRGAKSLDLDRKKKGELRA